MDLVVRGESFVLGDPEGWARFPCAECGKQLHVGDRVVMVDVNNGHLNHPAHQDRRKCRPRST